MADVSVIVAPYRRPPLIGRALDSIARQTMPPREIVVVDDASGDDTGDVVAAWSRHAGVPVTFIEAAVKGGAGRESNLGMMAASSPMIAFIDSADEYRPADLESLAAPLANHPAAVVSFADPMQHGNSGTPCHPLKQRGLPATG